MANETAYAKFYKKLISLYPRAFRERFGESMEQTFNDLFVERKKLAAGSSFGFVLWMSANTARGIVTERVSQITNGDYMQKFYANLGLAALISFILVLPFMILDWVNRRDLPESFPIALFVFMWLLAMVFIVILIPIVRNVRDGNKLMTNPVNLTFKVVLLLVVPLVWG